MSLPTNLPTSLDITNTLLSSAWSDWLTSKLPTKTVLLTITGDPVSLMSVITAAIGQAATEKSWYQLIQLSQSIRGAQASLTILYAELVLATATDASVQLLATQAIFNATLNLKDLEMEKNPYLYDLNRGGNIFFLVVFGIIFLFNTLMIVKSRYWWYNVTFFAGYALEVIGFIGRIISFKDVEDENAYLTQFVGLTIAPAFIMAGFYFLFAQSVVLHGRQYSVLKPLWYSYLFITCDILSLVIQAGGGASASIAYNNHKDTRPGTNTILAGIAFQLLSMTVFIAFWFEFLNRIFFKNTPDIDPSSPYKKRSVVNFFKLLFATPSARQHTRTVLDGFYNPKFQHIRSRTLFDWFPLAITVSVLAVYVRCIYRVIELAQGWRGYLITHEVYLMVLDALMMAIAGLIFIPFHPYFVFGKINVIKLASIRKRLDVEEKENSELEASSSLSDIQEVPAASDLNENKEARAS